MYQLIVILGPNQGTRFTLQDGDTTIGRQSGNNIILQSSKVSKQHCVLHIKDKEVIIQDLGSSNGTFVNGILAKTKKLKSNDRVSVGEYVFELVEIVSTQLSPLHHASALPEMIGQSSAGADQLNATPDLNVGSHNLHHPPKDIKGKIIWAFEYRIMPLLYDLNKKYEWNLICLGLFGFLIAVNLVISIYPLMQSSRSTIINEAGKRAQFIAKQIAERNAPFLAAHAETKVDLGIADSAEGVRVAVLVDLDNRILAPASKLNQYLAVGVEATTAVQAKERFRSGDEKGFVKVADSDSDTIIAIEPVKILSSAAGKNVVAAMVVVSIDTSISTANLGEMGVVYSETFLITGFIAAIILLIAYRLTLKPFQILNEDLDKALKGEIGKVTHEYKLQEMNPLWEIINSTIQRIPQSNSDGVGGMGGASLDPNQIMEEFLGPIKMLGENIKIGVVAFNSEKKISYLNPYFEEISGIRSENAMGMNISEVARDQSLVVFTQDILERIAIGSEGLREDYDFSGVSYKVHASAFGNPGGIAKCYLMIAIKVDT